MDQDVALNVDDIKFMLDHRMALRHVSNKSHLELHAQPGGTTGDAYPLGNYKSVLAPLPLEDLGEYESRYNTVLEEKPEEIIQEFDKRLHTSIANSISRDTNNVDAFTDSLKETQFLVLKDMSYIYGHADQEGSIAYPGTLGKCITQQIDTDKVCEVFGFTTDELKNMQLPAQAVDIAHTRCIQNIKSIRQEYEATQQFKNSPAVLSQAINGINERNIAAANERNIVCSYKIGAFETKLSEITGVDFKELDSGLVVGDAKDNIYNAQLQYQKQLLPLIGCRIATREGGMCQVQVDKAKVDMDKFESYYQWKKQDITHGEQMAQKVSAETGLNMQSKLGVVMLYDDNTTDFVGKAHKNDKIANLQVTMAENGYDYTFDSAPKGQTSGLVYTRQQPTVSVAGGMR